jgi:uroporphyrinogen-III decarboxylase
MPEDVSRRTRALVDETRGAAHIVNLGHGVMPGSHLECVEAFFAAAKQPWTVRREEAAAPITR